MPYKNPESNQRWRDTHKAEKKSYDKKYRAKRTAEIKAHEAARRRHGYYCYRGMLARCFYPKSNRYSMYGANGITVCKRWRGKNGWKNFLADMGPRPSFGHSLDRINNDGGYRPGNVRWATRKQQRKNRR